MKRLLAAALCMAVILSPARADELRHDAKTSDAVVRKVDRDAMKITLRHGPLPELGMDEPMTMVYRVKDPVLLEGLKAGDKVKFRAENAGGVFTITEIERTPQP